MRSFTKLYYWSESDYRSSIERKAEKKRQERELATKLDEIFDDNIVKHGPFKGMRYPAKKSVGSELYPKLLGSYEAELHPTLDCIFQRDYAHVIDVGCAEGYYAVGLAMRFPGAHVVAYDTDSTALELCQRMASLNSVKVTTRGHCSAKDLQRLKSEERSLIISDCEGYESELFTETLCEELKCHDFLIECHDFIQIDICARLSSLFSNTHQVEIIKSIDDTSKAYEYDFPELSGLELQEKKSIMGEKRPEIMRWIFAKSISR